MGQSIIIQRLFRCFLLVTLLTSCGFNTSKSSKDREELLKEIMSYQNRLPYNIPGTTMSIVDIVVDNDMVVYTCKVGEDDWGDISLISDVAGTDRNMARVISNVPQDAVNTFIKNGLGIRYIYKSVETGETLLSVEMSSEKMKDIRDKVKSGELQAFTMIELSKMELAKMEIPTQIDDGIWLTDAYIDNNKIYYICTIENEIDSSGLTNFELGEMKKEIKNSLKAEGFITIRKKEIAKENIHFIYVFKDKRGEEFARIDIGPYDLWGIEDLV